MPTSIPSKQRFWIAPLLLILSTACLAQAPVPEPATDVETEVGLEVYEELKANGEIVESSALYESLRPFAEALSRVAQPYYPHPLKFYIVHGPHPNAASTPGGNLYVVESLLTFVKNSEELAGTLCHEVAHTIHGDSLKRIEEEIKIYRRQLAAAILLGPTFGHVLALSFIGDLHRAGYSREVESKADITGADICVAAGYNPWGLVWLFQDFQSANPDQIPQLLSDHPANNTRIRALEQHFRSNPAVFGRFDPDRRSAHPLIVPKNAPEQR
jgi:predicted Zn-dependent protease